jgi:hypothetical protein
MSSEATDTPLVMTAMFRVGRYECVFSFGEPGQPFMSVEGSPSMPRRLSARHLRQCQRARDMAAAEVAAMTGMNALLIE